MPEQPPTESVLPVGTATLTDALDDYRLIRAFLAKTNGNLAAAAPLLGMHRSNLHHLAKRLGLREA